MSKIRSFIAAISLLAAGVACLVSPTPAAAQFADQATFAGTGAGSANAQTITVPNATSYADLVGVIIKYTPGATNTGAATLAVSGNAGALAGGPISFRKPNGSGMVALTGGELVAGQQTAIMYDQNGFFDVLSPTNLPVGAALLQSSALSFGFATNLQLNASVATNALTIAVKGANGSDPSATNPVLIPFRSSTIANGQPQVVSLQSALSFTIASGSSMGCVNNQMCRLWVVAICSSGLECTGSAGSDVVGLCAFNALSGTSIAPINEAALQTSASGTSGGNSAQTYYCNISGVTARAIRILGYVDIQEVSAGTWATGPTYVQLFGPGIKRPGDVVADLYASTGSNISNSNTYTTSNTPPAPANGTVALTAPALTPQSQANVIFATSGAVLGSSGIGNNAVTYLYNGSATVSTTQCGSTSGSALINCYLAYRAVAGSLTPVTYVLYFTTSGGIIATNGLNATPYLGGTGSTWLRVQEIMGALPEPANDDGSAEIRMVG